MAGKCEHGLTTKECLVCASPKYGDQQDPENWKARLAAAIGKLDEAINTGAPEPARRAMEIANQLLAEAVIVDAKKPPRRDA